LFYVNETTGLVNVLAETDEEKKGYLSTILVGRFMLY